MDFFAQQDRARRHTRWLIIGFALAVIALVATANIALAIFLGFTGSGTTPAVDADVAMKMHVALTLGVLGMIAVGSWSKIISLRAGGQAVAAMMGGRPVHGTSQVAQERVLLNVVEEMALASGVPVPPVYVLDDEPTLNAFAAGHRPEDAVVTVTRGCLDRLNRDELQGVVGHEFSHILNGDMRLNLRLIGVLNGILLIGLTGRGILRLCGNMRTGRGKDGNGVAVVLAAGVVMIAIGSLGTLIGRLITSAVSRNREYLADASSVQFTRNPGGIGGALKKIGAPTIGSLLRNHRAVETSHLFIANAVGGWFSGAFATHPPIERRIRAVDERWDGTWPSLEAIAEAEEAPPASPTLPGLPTALGAVAFAGVGATSTTARIASPSPQHVAFAEELLRALPADLVAAAREPFAARALIVGLALDSDASAREQQLVELATRDAPLAQEVRRLQPAIAALGLGARLPLIDLAAPALRQLSPSQRTTFLAVLQAMIDSDGSTSIDEYLLLRLVMDRLQPNATTISGELFSLRPLAQPTAVILSALARAGSEPERAFAIAIQRCFDRPDALSLLPAADCGPAQLDQAFTALTRAATGVKRRLVDACAWCAASDGRIEPREAELLRVICACLGCPLPLFMDGAKASLTG